MKELITIIIPIYNAEKYLERCINSVLNQTYPDFELLLIDDGSTDGSGALCDKFAKKDSRIKVFHVENGGVSAARNYGLNQMNGLWFCFIDSDDWVEPEYLQVLHDNAVKFSCDVSACSYERNYQYSIGTKDKKKMIVLESEQACINNFICPDLSMDGITWNKLYRSQEFQDYRFNTLLKVNEDCLYTYDVLSHCKKACVTEKELYHWFLYSNSACHSKPQKLDFSAADVFLIILKKIENMGDVRAETELKKNYISSVLFVLWNVPHNRNDALLTPVFERLKQWKPIAWKRMSVKDKIKYFLCVRAPFIRSIAVRILKHKK